MAESESDGLARMIASGFKEVRQEMADRFGAMDKRFDAVEAGLASVEAGQKTLRSDVQSVLANHSKRITALERRGGGRRS